MFTPSIITVPPSRERLPHIMEMVVLLPAPFTPKKANSSPRFTLNERSFTAFISPNDLLSPSITIISSLLSSIYNIDYTPPREIVKRIKFFLIDKFLAI